MYAVLLFTSPYFLYYLLFYKKYQQYYLSTKNRLWVREFLKKPSFKLLCFEGFVSLKLAYLFLRDLLPNSFRCVFCCFPSILFPFVRKFYERNNLPLFHRFVPFIRALKKLIDFLLTIFDKICVRKKRENQNRDIWLGPVWTWRGRSISSRWEYDFYSLNS